MSRRRFLSDALCSAIALTASPMLLRAGAAAAGEPAEFAAGLRKYPWLGGWKSVGAETLGPVEVELQGRLPKDLSGILYRNGPAWLERNNFRYDHAFDGDGMVHRWQFEGNRVKHRASMVATPKFVREKQAGRFLYPAAGTMVPNAEPMRNTDDVNTANTAVMAINGRVFALWEAGSAFEVDADNLATLGPVTWRQDMATAPFSAHPLRDRDGSYWNFGALGWLGGTGLLIWHVGADGKLQRAQILDCPTGYLHSFAMTDHHLVFMLIPYRMDEQGAPFERMQFLANESCRVAVVAKDTPDQARWFEADFAAVYHFGDAYERDGAIMVRAIRHPDLGEFKSPLQMQMHGHPGSKNFDARLVTLRLDLRRGQASWQDEAAGHNIEFPTFDARTPSDRPARLYTPARQDPASATYFNAVAGFDVERGHRDVYSYGRDILAEEHVFVPRPGSQHPDDGWLIGTLYDGVRNRSGIAVLDAQRISEGPLAQAWLPYAFPLGLHGCFVAT